MAVWMITHQLDAVRGRVDRTLALEAGRIREGRA
jgi:ABC-type methionine transport system ATPase subunit